MSQTIINGDSAEVLKTIKDNTIDAVITDPPYGIEFLGKEWDRNTGAREIWQECLRVLKPGGHLLAFSAARTYHNLASNIESVGFEIRDQIMWIYASGFPKAQAVRGHTGWKTALKPAHEPIVMARKPFKGSTYANMDKHGVGALNIDESRIPTTDTRSGGANGVSRLTFGEGETSNEDSFRQYTPNEQGRYPSNVLGDIADYQKYFYCPKVTRKERHRGTDNNHPTVKPVALMRYLVKLVTASGAHILDPFSGSGSTGMACKELGRQFTGIDLDENYCEIAKRRISATKTDPREQLFE
jgi:site-specific DNA-methyltransferase (adenine-specific)